MATATQVTIKVVVDGAQAGPAIDQINKGLGEIGVKGSASLGQASAAADKLGGHVSTSLDGVRLMSQEFGLKMPRALEAMASRMPGITNAITKMMSAFTFIAVGEIAVRVGETIYHAFDIGGERARAMQKDVLDANLEMRRLNDTLDVQIDKLEQEKAKLEHKPAPNGMKLAIDEATLAADELSVKLEEIEGKYQKAIAGMGGGFLERAINGQSDAKPEQRMYDDHQRNLLLAKSSDDITKENVSFGKALDARMQKLQKEAAIYKEVAKWEGPLSTRLIMTNPQNDIDATAILMKMQQQEGTVVQKTGQRDQLQAQVNALHEQPKAGNKETAISVLAQLQREANEAGLKDDERLTQQRLDDLQKIDDKMKSLHAKAPQIAQAEALINQKFDREHDANLQKQIDEAQKLLRDASAAGLTGLPKIEQEYKDRNADIDAQAGVPQQVKDIQHQAAKVTRDQRAGEYYQENDIKEATDKSDADKKELDRQARIADQETAYAMRAAEAERRAKQAGLNGWIQDHAAAVAAIQAQEEAEYTKLNGLRVQEKMSDAEYAEAKTNIDRTANAEIEQQNQAMAHQISNTLSEAFTNPIDFIKRKMQQMMMDILANAIMQTKAFKSILGQSMGAAQPGAPGAAGGGGILGAVSSAVRGTFPGHPVAAISGTGAIAGSAGAPNYSPETAASSSSSSSGVAHRPEYSGSVSSSTAASGAGSSVSAIATDVPGLYRRLSAAHGETTETSGMPSAGVGAGAQGGASSDDIPQVSKISVSGAGGSQPGLPTGGVGKTVVSDVQSARSLAGTISGAAGSGSSAGSDPYTTSGDDDGNVTLGGDIPDQGNPDYQTPAASAGSNAMSKGMAVAGAGMAGYEGYEDTKADFKSGSAGGTIKGMLGDAMAVAAIGSLAGPVGTLVGAGVGAAVGLAAGVVGAIMGEGGKLAARDYYKKTIFPEIENDRNNYAGGDWQTAISDVNRTATDGVSYMGEHWGTGAANWVNQNYLMKEQKLAVGEIEARAKGGSFAVGMSAAQFHGGGTIRHFGDLATSPTEGFIHALLDEKVVKPSAASTHGPEIDAMNAGATRDQVGAMYKRPGDTSSQPRGSELHVHIHGFDGPGTEQWLRNGGAQKINKHLNEFNGQYAGDGVSG